MLYKYALEVGKADNGPTYKELDVNLIQGVIDPLTIEFPAGCQGLVGIRILQGLFQIWPLTSGEWVAGDDITVISPKIYELEAGRDRLRIEGRNQDTANDHTITVGFNIDISVDYVKELVGAVAEAFPSLKDALVERLDPLLGVTKEVRGLLEEGVLPSLQEVVQLLREEKEREVSKMPLSELVRF